MLWNKLKLNADKTHLMTVGTSKRLQTQDTKVAVVIDGCVLEESMDEVEVLRGCQIEPDLKWHKELLKKLRKRLNALENLRNIIPFHLRKIISEGIFENVLSYCLPLLEAVTRVRLKHYK